MARQILLYSRRRQRRLMLLFLPNSTYHFILYLFQFSIVLLTQTADVCLSSNKFLKFSRSNRGYSRKTKLVQSITIMIVITAYYWVRSSGKCYRGQSFRRSTRYLDGLCLPPLAGARKSEWRSVICIHYFDRTSFILSKVRTFCHCFYIILTSPCSSKLLFIPLQQVVR
jgi:hypothetical protein